MRAVLVIAASVLAACSSPSARTSQFRFGDAATLATTGNLRLVTERSRLQQDGRSLPILCTEPSPDYAIAFGTAVSANAKGTVPTGGAGEGAFSASTTEDASELAGRTAGVLALRDGLYAACQSYVNGVIGHDAYAMILSQYGSLLVALVGDSGSGGRVAVNTTGNVTVNGGGLPSASGGDVTATSKRAALAALLVACVSEHDGTRYPAVRGGDRSSNRLLDERFCRQVLQRSLVFASSADR